MSETLLVRGGRVVTAEGEFEGDVLVEGETVAAVGRDLRPAEVDRVIDAGGCLVLPGCVDVHTHLDVEFQGISACDDFGSGTRAAACGGTTTVVDYAEQAEGGSIADGLRDWHGRLERGPIHADVGCHVIVRRGDPDTLEEVRRLAEVGVTTVKLHLAYPGVFQLTDAEIFRFMRIARDTGSLALMHAENGDVIEVLIDEARAAGHRDPIWHARTRPPLTEVESVQRTLLLARMAECPVYVVHVSCAEAATAIAGARDDGMQVWGEVCLHHLFADEADLERPDGEGAKWVFSPPPRSAPDRDALWHGLATGGLSVIASDHFPTRLADRLAVAGGDFSQIPNGTGGIEERLMLIHHHGVNAGRFTLSRMVQLLASNPARLFGLYPRKGTIAPGSDADLVIFDPDREVTIAADRVHSRSDYTVYEGMNVRGAPTTVLLRGSVVVEDGEPVETGPGKFLERQTFDART